MGSKNRNSVNQKKRRGRKRKKVLIIFAVIAAVAGTLFGVTYKVFEDRRYTKRKMECFNK